MDSRTHANKLLECLQVAQGSGADIVLAKTSGTLGGPCASQKGNLDTVSLVSNNGTVMSVAHLLDWTRGDAPGRHSEFAAHFLSSNASPGHSQSIAVQSATRPHHAKGPKAGLLLWPRGEMVEGLLGSLENDSVGFGGPW